MCLYKQFWNLTESTLAGDRDFKPAGSQFQTGQKPGQVCSSNVFSRGVTYTRDLPFPTYLMPKVSTLLGFRRITIQSSKGMKTRDTAHLMEPATTWSGRLGAVPTPPCKGCCPLSTRMVWRPLGPPACLPRGRCLRPQFRTRTSELDGLHIEWAY